MLLENIYLEDDEWVKKKWAMCLKEHRDSWSVPNPFLEILFLHKNHIHDLININAFIETGTSMAYTAEIMAKHFSAVYTIEKFMTEEKELSHHEIKNNNPNINFFYGDSVTHLINIYPLINNEKAIILLDAHDGYETPLIDELKIIKQFYNNQSVLIIDDCYDLGSGSWPSKETFEKMLYDINSDYKIVHTGLGRGICLVYP